MTCRQTSAGAPWVQGLDMCLADMSMSIIHTPRLYNFRITEPCRAGMSSIKPHFALTPTNAHGIAAQHKTPQAGKQTPSMSARAGDNGKSSITPPPFLAEAPHPPEVALEICTALRENVGPNNKICNAWIDRFQSIFPCVQAPVVGGQASFHSI